MSPEKFFSIYKLIISASSNLEDEQHFQNIYEPKSIVSPLGLKSKMPYHV